MFANGTALTTVLRHRRAARNVCSDAQRGTRAERRVLRARAPARAQVQRVPRRRVHYIHAQGLQARTARCVLLIPLWRPAARRARRLAPPLATRERTHRLGLTIIVSISRIWISASGSHHHRLHISSSDHYFAPKVTISTPRSGSRYLHLMVIISIAWSSSRPHQDDLTIIIVVS